MATNPFPGAFGEPMYLDENLTISHAIYFQELENSGAGNAADIITINNNKIEAADVPAAQKYLTWDSFVGSGETSKDFTFSWRRGSIQVFFDKRLQHPETDYQEVNVSGVYSRITFTNAIPDGTEVDLWYFPG